LPVVIVTVDEFSVVLAGLALADVAAGNPETLSVTFPLNPCVRVIDTLTETAVPCTATTEPGTTDSEKSPVGGGGLAGGSTQLLAALENSNWIV
jgi:hypothetical protein